MVKTVKVGNVAIGTGKLVLIAGPCVIEDRKGCVRLAVKLAQLAKAEKIPFIFKASYDKANRSSIESYRGPGLSKGLDVLKEIKEKTGVPVLTDVHSEAEVGAVSKVVDVIQIPAFLCRQTDLIVAAAETGLPVNVKKGQFLAPWDMSNIVKKIEHTGNKKILLTERGTSFGYNNLVVDMRGLSMMRQMGYPVIFDATHSVQKPGGAGNRSSGDGSLAPMLARGAVAVGCDGIFVETHLRPEKALSDKDNMIPFNQLRKLWRQLIDINRAIAGK